MKKFNDSHMGLGVMGAGAVVLAVVIAGSKVQRQVERNADHPIDRKVVFAALGRVHAESGVHPLPDIYPHSASDPTGPSTLQTKPVQESTPGVRASTPHGVLTMTATDTQDAAGGSLEEADSKLLRAQESLKQAMEAVDKARTELRTSVAFRAQPNQPG